MWSPWVGFHAMVDTGEEKELDCDSQRSSHHGFFWRRSHTMTVPLVAEEARMWGTWEFHATC